MNRLGRREIPPLIPRISRLGKAGTLRRSFPTGPSEYFRVYNSEPLHLEVTLIKEQRDLTLVLYSNLGSHEDVWHDIRFDQIAPQTYAVDVPVETCGYFRFRLKYTLDGGRTWCWDRAPFSEVLVDPANTRDTLMYTLIPTASGHIGQWKEQLHHIHAMHFNSVHLLPVTRMGDSNSPYAAANLFEIDPSFLDPSDQRQGLDQFEDFVETAKGLGLRLCMDLVLNHVGVSSDLVKSCPGWIVADESEADGLRRAGCWHKNLWLKWGDLVQINYDHPQRHIKTDIWQYMTKYAHFWANYAEYTGGLVRFDNLHSSHEAFITHCTRSLRRESNGVVILAEFFSDLATLERRTPEWGLNLLLANPWEYGYAAQLREYISFLHEASGRLRYFVPVTSHDTPSPTQLFGEADATVARYFVCALFTSGQTGIVQGVEHAVAQKVEFIGKHLKLLVDRENHYQPFISKVNALLGRYKTFTNSGNIRFVDSNHDAILAALRFGGFCDENDFLVVANLDTKHEQSIDLDLSGGELTLPCRLANLLTDEDITLTEPHLHLTLAPSTVRAFELQAEDTQDSRP